MRSNRSSISRRRSSCRIRCADPLGYYRNNTANSRALIEAAVNGGVEHFIFSSTAAVYGNPDTTPVTEDVADHSDVALRLVEADDRNHAARRRGGAWSALRDPALFQCRRRRPATAHRPDRRPARPISSRSRSRPRSASAPRSTCSAPIIRRRTAPASAITSMSAIWRARIRCACASARAAAAASTFNCGYGHGYSVLEVIEAVKRVSGRNFAVITGRSPARRSGRDCRRLRPAIKSALGWTPRFDDLDTIVAHALALERQLASEARHQARRARLSAQVPANGF